MTEAAAKMRAKDVTIRYGEKVAVKDVSIDVLEHEVLALIGPSGCGKSTFLRSLNRMNDTIDGVTLDGRVELDGEAIYGHDVDPVLVRRRVGMVFQRVEPVPEDHLRERRLRPSHRRRARASNSSRKKSSARCGRPRSGTR